ncbi:hypothetical protein B0H13DRAFT_2340644 [Mycena leptocephala]|nr:hypothetical protein B0H13DRAFT_2346063 [Mycena leptocephala]KAJ7891151.1 hypothetical protein B0H13DRAFT_2340644 [Mycena leptocephala]
MFIEQINQDYQIHSLYFLLPSSLTFTMYAIRMLSFILATSVALVAANPFVQERQTCNCESPSGCPGTCAPLQGSGHSYCIGYCGENNAVICDACGFTTDNCIVNTDGSCFTVNE